MTSPSQSAHQPSRFWTWITVFVFLAASSIEARHICGLEGIISEHSLNVQGPLASPTAICPICINAQPATSTAPVLAQAPTLALTMAVASTTSSFSPNEDRFSLYIRPPPSR